ncbi:MAG: ABC transporter ATP-binding protein [Candidatus Muiribacteriaceae bacterium]
METILKVRKVNIQFDVHKVLDDMDLDVYKGECLCIMGRSGCGKSVLMKVITGLLVPDSGSVYLYDDEMIFTDESYLRKYRERFGMVFQGAALFDYMDVYDNIAFGLRYNRRFSEERIREEVFSVLSELALEESAHVFPDQLSGGMKKRVALARALVLKPEILIYDEPTTGLDAVMVRNIDRLIKETQEKRSTTSIVITHDVDSAMRIADRIAIHSDGRILESGSRDEICASRQDETRLILDGELL